MARQLTAKAVENIRPSGRRIEVPDGGCRGLYLVVQPSGRKSWAVRYRYQRKPKKLTLDQVISLAEARKAATAALHELEQGRDPAALKFDAKAIEQKANAARAADTIEAWAATFIAQHVEKNTGVENQRQAGYVFDKIALPKWRGRSIHDIKRKDIIALVEKVAEDRPYMANRALGHLRKLF